MATKTASFQEILDINVGRKIPENKSKIIFDQNSFNIFMSIDGEESLLNIYKKSNIDKQSFTQAIKKLFMQGLIFRVSDKAAVSKETIETIESSLAVYVGPVAKLIVMDAFEALGFAENKLPSHNLILLIEKIADQIPYDKAQEFKKSLKEMMKHNI